MKETDKTRYDYFLKYLGSNANREKVVHFNEMPVMAKEILVGSFGGILPMCGLATHHIGNILQKGCDSPIEYIYGIALSLCAGYREDELYGDTFEVEGGYETRRTADLDTIIPQKTIYIGGKVYRPDFTLDIDYMGTEIVGGQQHQDIIVECDGFDYHHATKEQVNHDNERELAIKKAGYEVLRFSGSQIYNDPFKCANDTIDYIISEMNRRCEEAS